MAVISIDEVFAGRAATVARDWSRRYTRRFRVLTDDPQTEGIAVIEAAIGTIGNAYSAGGKSDLGSFCSQVTATDLGEDGKSWMVQADYGPYDPNINPKDPTQWPIKVSWGTAQFQRVVDYESVKDDSGTPVAIGNSAGDRYLEAVEIDDSRDVLVVVRNESAFSETLASQYRDHINSDPFWGHDPYTVKCASIEAEQVHNTDIGWYWVVTYQFEFNDDTWDRKLLDRGFREINSGGTDTQAMLDDRGLPASGTPMLLDGSGKKLALDAEEVYNTHRVYDEIDFDGLNLTTDMIPS